MKKIFFLSLMCVITTGIHAQFRLGVTGGVAFTGTSTKDYVKVERIASPTFGIIAQFKLGPLAFRPSFNFISQGFNYTREAIQRATAAGNPDTLTKIISEVKTKNFEIPLDIVVPLKMKKGRLLFSFAPVITIGFKGDSTVSGSQTAGSSSTVINRINRAIDFGDNSLQIKRTSWGTRFGIGYEFRSGLQFNAGYKVGLTNLNNDGTTTKYHHFTLGLAWFLFKR